MPLFAVVFILFFDSPGPLSERIIPISEIAEMCTSVKLTKSFFFEEGSTSGRVMVCMWSKYKKNEGLAVGAVSCEPFSRC